MVSAPVFSKTESLTCDYLFGLKPADQDSDYEFRRGKSGESPVERDDDGRFDSKTFESREALAKGVDHRQRPFAQDFFRVRIECQDGRDQFVPAGLSEQDRYYLPVPEVNAVEIADGHGPRPAGFREIFES